MTITIDSAAEFLNDHSRMFSTEIQTKTRVGLEMENLLPQRMSTGEYYVVENAEATELLQPYQGAFTPKGEVTHSENSIRVRPVKLDMEFTEIQLEKWWNSFMVSRFDVEKDPESWTFPRYIFERELLPKFQNDLNRIAWLGQYAAPTPGTPGDAVDSVDGFKKIIADSITSLAIPAANVITTTALSSSNARGKIELFLDSIPEEITSKGGRILCSPTIRRYYFRDYRGEFTQSPGPFPTNNAPRQVFVDDYNVSIEAVTTMAESGRIIFLPNNRPNNMVWVSRTGSPVYPQMIFKSQARVLQMYATIYRGYGFEYPQEIFVNEQV